MELPFSFLLFSGCPLQPCREADGVRGRDVRSKLVKAWPHCSSGRRCSKHRTVAFSAAARSGCADQLEAGGRLGSLVRPNTTYANICRREKQCGGPSLHHFYFPSSGIPSF